jgi:formamidopyrimidine-DNA glycosylase
VLTVPELPDVTVYVERIRALAAGQALQRLRLAKPFLLRSVEPKPEAFRDRILTDVTRLGKRLVLAYQGDLFMVLHLMIAGRLHWRAPGAVLGGRMDLAALDFPNGSLVLTEAGTKHRASLYLVAGESGLEAFRRGGVDLLTVTPPVLAAALKSRNRTLKRALTDPDVVDGVGNAYSDEILHRARQSPFRPTTAMTADEVEHLLKSARAVLEEWTERLRVEAAHGFPENVTAFRPEMAVHGKYGEPCPACGAPVQRIRYADNEANYCPNCQTGGRLLADRSLSRLLREDWPRTLAELEEGRHAYPERRRNDP